MKKIFKVIGFLAAIVLAMFLNTNTIESNKSVKFSLADAISMQSANAECPDWIPDYLCDDDDDDDVYGEVSTPITMDCPTGEKTIIWGEYPGEYYIRYETETRSGTGCIDAQTPGPLYCTPEYPC